MNDALRFVVGALILTAAVAIGVFGPTLTDGEEAAVILLGLAGGAAFLYGMDWS